MFLGLWTHIDLYIMETYGWSIWESHGDNLILREIKRRLHMSDISHVFGLVIAVCLMVLRRGNYGD